MKELYISPETEIICFFPVQHVASEPLWKKEGLEDDEPDLSAPGSQIPGWGN